MKFQIIFSFREKESIQAILPQLSKYCVEHTNITFFVQYEQILRCDYDEKNVLNFYRDILKFKTAKWDSVYIGMLKRKKQFEANFGDSIRYGLTKVRFVPMTKTADSLWLSMVYDKGKWQIIKKTKNSDLEREVFKSFKNLPVALDVLIINATDLW